MDIPPAKNSSKSVSCLPCIESGEPKSRLEGGQGRALRNKMVAVNMISCGSYTAASKENGLEVLRRGENGLKVTVGFRGEGDEEKQGVGEIRE